MTFSISRLIERVTTTAVVTVAGVFGLTAGDIELHPSVPDIKSSIVVVNSDQGYGTGWAIAPGIIATNKHVVEGCKDIVLTDYKGEEYDKITRVWMHPVLDIAFIVAPVKLPVLDLADKSAKIFDDIFTTGHGSMMWWQFTSGVMEVRLNIQGQHMFATTLAITSGDSGSPVINTAGKIVGMVTAGVYQLGTDKHGKPIKKGLVIPVTDLKKAFKEFKNGSNDSRTTRRSRAAGSKNGS